MVSGGLKFYFGLGLSLGLELGFTVWVSLRLGSGLGWCFLFVHWRANKLCLFQIIIGFYGLLAGNEARTEVLPLSISSAQPMIYWSADIYQPILWPSRYIVSALCRL